MSDHVPWKIEQRHGTEAIRIRDDKGEIRGEFATLKDLAAHTALLEAITEAYMRGRGVS